MPITELGTEQTIQKYLLINDFHNLVSQTKEREIIQKNYFLFIDAGKNKE